MGDGTGIGWTDATWNPVTGCSHVSDGCRFCYAETSTGRFAGRPGWPAVHLPWTAGNAEANVILYPERLDVPLRWRRPRTVFVNSMSDLFHEEVPDEFIQQVFDVVMRARQHTFQILTKRPERMRDWMQVWLGDIEPPPNCWLGVSIESRRHVDRADVLRATSAAHRFISAEPLLGPLIERVRCGRCDCEGWVADGDLAGGCDDCEQWGYFVPGGPLDLTRIDWLIVGGESGEHFAERPDRFLVDAPNGGKPRPEALEWVRDLRDACEAAGTHFMLKQWGGRTPRSGGRVLDGRTHDWVPSRAGEEVQA